MCHGVKKDESPNKRVRNSFKDVKRIAESRLCYFQPQRLRTPSKRIETEGILPNKRNTLRTEEIHIINSRLTSPSNRQLDKSTKDLQKAIIQNRKKY